MSGRGARLKEELRKIFVIALFFATGFVLILFAERLFVRGSSLPTGSIFRALIGGLIVAKLLLIVDLLPFVHAFPNKPLVQNIAWKSSLYIAASILFSYIDPFIKALLRGMSLSGSHAAALEELMRPRTWAIEIWLGMLLVTFVTMQELSRVIGKDEFKRIFFGYRERRAAEKRFHAA